MRCTNTQVFFEDTLGYAIKGRTANSAWAPLRSLRLKVEAHDVISHHTLSYAHRKRMTIQLQNSLDDSEKKENAILCRYNGVILPYESH